MVLPGQTSPVTAKAVAQNALLVCLARAGRPTLAARKLRELRSLGSNAAYHGLMWHRDFSIFFFDCTIYMYSLLWITYYDFDYYYYCFFSLLFIII